MSPLVDIRGLELGLGEMEILRGVDLRIGRGEAVGLVGESGSGKSMLALALMGLEPDGMWRRGSVRFDGRELIGQGDREMSRIRGRRIAMVFQEPMTALDPVRTIGEQVAEGPRWHFGLSRRAARDRAREMLEKVGMPEDRFSLGLYPHQLSGGQRQRVVVAMALSCGPELLIADEPTTALDVTIQAQILDLLCAVTAESGMALLMISHDLGVIAETTDRMYVMRAGEILEEGPTEQVFREMAHPYTRALFEAMPSRDLMGRRGGGT
ncbi:ABC transporter ATP-binding protein [Lutibaculum baratangense]|uniref:Oligopeptide transport ATP-binding protein OppD n=1 Tax=Lutibaculum baratangense AMV1 TaxID=631454 RepID=V4QXW4_9HYPH|nr:ABC transporter ATP-binding protein [Lutibaculum baratangense]ESR24592.1 Oligopeptide transport ATP-binding protein OppD [Lutibaculum baratangense AMV1]